MPPRTRKATAKALRQPDICMLWISYTEKYFSVQIAVECLMSVREFKSLVTDHYLKERSELFGDIKISNFDIDIYPTPINENETMAQIKHRNGGLVPAVIIWPLPDGTSPVSNELKRHRMNLLLNTDEHDRPTSSDGKSLTEHDGANESGRRQIAEPKAADFHKPIMQESTKQMGIDDSDFASLKISFEEERIENSIRYNNLQSQYRELNTQYRELNSQYRKLNSQYGELWNEFSTKALKLQILSRRILLDKVKDRVAEFLRVPLPLTAEDLARVGLVFPNLSDDAVNLVTNPSELRRQGNAIAHDASENDIAEGILSVREPNTRGPLIELFVTLFNRHPEEILFPV